MVDKHQTWVAAMAHASWRYEAEVTGDFMGGFNTAPGKVVQYEAEEQRYLFENLEWPCGDPRLKRAARGGGAGGPGVDELKVLERLLPACHDPICGVIGAYCPDYDGKAMVNDLVQHGIAPLCRELPIRVGSHTAREAYMLAKARQVSMCVDPSVATEYSFDLLREPSQPYDIWSTPQFQLYQSKVAFIPGECFGADPETVATIVNMMLASETDNVIIMTLPPVDVMARLWPDLLLILCKTDWVIGTEEQWHYIARKFGVALSTIPGEVLWHLCEKMNRPNPKRVRTFFCHRYGTYVWVQHRPGDGHQDLPRPMESDYEGIHNVIGPSEVGDRGGLSAWIGGMLFALHRGRTFEQMMALAHQVGTKMCLNTYFDINVLNENRADRINPEELK